VNASLQTRSEDCRRSAARPVLSVLTFASTKEAVALANQASYGLSAGVWSRDLDTVTEVGRKVRAGTVWSNTFMDGFAELPFGRFKQSGLGRELGRNAVADYTEDKTFHVHNGPRQLLAGPEVCGVKGKRGPNSGS
jgi:betaine-aldehyde dehydrogenase